MWHKKKTTTTFNIHNNNYLLSVSQKRRAKKSNLEYSTHFLWVNSIEGNRAQNVSLWTSGQCQFHCYYLCWWAEDWQSKPDSPKKPLLSLWLRHSMVTCELTSKSRCVKMFHITVYLFMTKWILSQAFPPPQSLLLCSSLHLSFPFFNFFFYFLHLCTSLRIWFLWAVAQLQGPQFKPELKLLSV